MSPLTSLAYDLLEKPANLPTASNYTALNGVIYLGIGVLLIVWPGVTQTIFMDADFVGLEGALIRVIGLTLVVIGGLYFFRRSFRRATNRRRICGRPVGVRSCGARAPDYRRRFPAFAGDVSDSRPGARHWRMGASQS
jgi:hypothetical protein